MPSFNNKVKKQKQKIAVLGVSTRCNLNCVFCSDRYIKNAPEPSFDEIKSKVDSLKKEGAEEIIYMACESLLRKDFLEIADYVNKRGLVQILITNGILLANKDFLKKIIDSSIKNIQISMSCFDSVSSKKTTGDENAWKKQLVAIKNIKEHNRRNKKNKVIFTLRIVVSQINVNNVVKIIQNCKKAYGSDFKILFKLVHLQHLKKLIPGILPEPDQVKKCIKKVAEYLGESFKKEDVSFDNFPLCMISGMEECSREVRDVGEKTEYFFDTYKQKMRKKGEKIFAVYAKTRECKKCDHDLICAGVWPDYLKYFGAKALIPAKDGGKD